MSNGTVVWTDIPRGPSSQALDSAHLFERVGLGKAPFRVRGFAEIKPGTTCGYCGTPCIYVAKIESADGKKFHVGCDCVSKVGDGGLLAAIKRSPEYREIQRQKRYALDEAKKLEIEEILQRLQPTHALTVEAFRSRLNWCGMAGRARILKELRQVQPEGR